MKKKLTFAGASEKNINEQVEYLSYINPRWKIIKVSHVCDCIVAGIMLIILILIFRIEVSFFPHVYNDQNASI